MVSSFDVDEHGNLWVGTIGEGLYIYQNPIVINPPDFFSSNANVLIENITTIDCANFNSEFNSTNPSCFGEDNGEASIHIWSGTPPFTYYWSNGNTTAADNSHSY